MNDRAIIVGCGEMGCKTLRRCIPMLEHPRVDFIAMSTKEEDVAYSGCRRKVFVKPGNRDILISAQELSDGGTSTGLHDCKYGDALSRADMVITLCDIGDEHGAAIASFVGRSTYNSSIQQIAVASFPDSSEGPHCQVKTHLMACHTGQVVTCQEKANKALEALRGSMKVVILVPAAAIRNSTGERHPEIIQKTVIEVMALVTGRLTEAIVMRNHVHLDLGDISCIFHSGRVAMVGIGKCDVQEETDKAVEDAFSSPLLDQNFIPGAEVLCLITGGDDWTFRQAENIAGNIHEKIDANSVLIWGSRKDKRMGNYVEVVVIFVLKG